MASIAGYAERMTGLGHPFSASEEMIYEVLRLASYVAWPFWANKRPTELASCGFYFSGHDDQVICFNCHGKISNWSQQQDIIAEHKCQFPQCAFARGRLTENVSMGPSLLHADSPGESSSHGSGYSSLPATATAVTKPPQNSIHEVDVLLQEMNSLPGENPPSMTSLPYLPPLRTGQRVSGQQSGSSVLSADRYSIQDIGEVLQQEMSSSQQRVGRIRNGEQSSQSEPIQEVDRSFVKHEQYRLRTFEGKWLTDSFLSPVDLARAGFFYVGRPDKVQCAFCSGRLVNWKATDQPMNEHRHHFPDCPFVSGQSTNNVPIENSRAAVTVPPNMEEVEKRQQTPSERLGIMMDKPKHPEYAIELSRLDSFKMWPKKTTVSPQKLAQAGFFYIGYSDNVKCFFCDGGLRNWETGDEPWKEHAKWFSRCGYLRLTMGEDYINQVKDRVDQAKKTEKGSGIAGAAIAGIVSSPRTFSSDIPLQNKPQINVKTVDPREIKARMDTREVRAVLDMGFSEDLVKQVLEKHLAENGDDFPSIETLLQAVIAQQEAERKKSQQQTVSQQEVAAAKKAATSRRKKKNRKKKKKAAQEAETMEVLTMGATAAELPGGESESGDEEETAVEEAAIESAIQGDEEVQQLAQQYNRIKEERTCKICMDEDCTIVFLPCGHLVCCAKCAPALRNCPICRTLIKGSVRIFTT